MAEPTAQPPRRPVAHWDAGASVPLNQAVHQADHRASEQHPAAEWPGSQVLQQVGAAMQFRTVEKARM